MILEGVVTTVAADGTVNIAPMGPHVPDSSPPAKLDRFVLRPFRTAHTYTNLELLPEGVFHVTDDVLLLARAAIGPVEAPLFPAARVRGWVLHDACRYYEFRIVARDISAERAELHAEVVHSGRLRDFFGFNRGKHAALEAAILATRLHLLPREEIEGKFRELAVLVEKTGGPQEREAFALLRAHVDAGARARRGPGEAT
jgi:hypothetical protein